MSEIKLYHGDCLEIMKDMPDKSVNAIITDIPYGTTACSWDEVIPFEPMWEQAKRITDVFVTTASQPFTSKLVMSNLEWFRYEWIWNKVDLFTGYLNAKIRPMKQHENILLFANGNHIYNDQKRIGKPYRSRGSIGEKAKVYNTRRTQTKTENLTGIACASTIINIRARGKNAIGLHSTQKPVTLYTYLIRTYTNEDDTVMDICMGSGTSGVACILTNRNFVGVEIDDKYYQVAKRRINSALEKKERMNES